MGKLLAIIGNIGVGKTTLSLALQRTGGFIPALEEHETRPFQQAFVDNLGGYAFRNQMDYLVFRAEQEAALRSSSQMSILDGGLDMDFEVFTRYFFQKGYLTLDEFQLCERLYKFVRQLIPPPDLYLYLQAPQPVIRRRLAQRGRPRVAKEKDLSALDVLLKDWVERVGAFRVLNIDAAADSFSSPTRIADLLEKIDEMLALVG